MATARWTPRTSVAVGAILIATMGGASCGGNGAPASVETAPTQVVPSASASEPTDELAGQLMFSRFNESTHTFVSTHVANPDGRGERELTLPGPEGGGRFSHDGEHIAVMTLTDDDRVGTAIITPDGTVERVLTLPDATINLVCTVWLADDADLGCQGWDDKDPSRAGIYTVSSADGSDVRRLSAAPGGMNDVPGDISPDGTSLLFKRSTDEEPGQLMVVDITGGEPEAVSDGVFEDPGRYRPDGAGILTSAAGTIVLLDRDGDVAHEIAEDDAYLFGAVWSPDGQWIAFSRATGGPYADVYISRPDGSERSQVTATADNEIAVEWGA